MKKLVALTALTASAMSFAAGDTESRLKQLEEKLEKLDYETSAASNIKLGGQLENRYDYTDTNVKASAAGKRDSTNGLFSTYFRLNLHSKVNDQVEFFGRLSMAKFWNDSTTSGPTSASTLSAGRGRTGAALYMERAFINWNFANTWSFSIGRLPTLDGAPKHFSVGTSAMGAYPLVAYAYIFDGMALTKKFDGNDWDLKLRAVYTPFQTVNYSALTQDLTDSAGDRISEKQGIYVLNADYELRNLSFAKRWQTIVQLSDADGLYSAPFGAAPTYSATGNLKLRSKTGTFYTEFNDVLGLGLDIYGSYKYSITKSQGTVTGAGGFFSDSTATADKKYNGKNFWIGFRQTVGSSNHVGLEYVKNSDQAVAFDLGQQDLINFYATPASSGVHGFWTSQLGKGFTSVLGATYQHLSKTYVSGVFGAPQHADITNKSFYARLIANF